MFDPLSTHFGQAETFLFELVGSRQELPQKKPFGHLKPDMIRYGPMVCFRTSQTGKGSHLMPLRKL